MSFFACAMSCITAASRTMFLMGTQNVLPASLGRVHARHQTPHVAVLVSSVAAGLPAILLAARHVRAFDLYGWLATIATYGFLAAYVCVTVAAPVHALRRRHLTVPKATLAGLTVSFLVWAFIASLPPANSTGPERLLAPLFVVLIIAGCAYCVTRRRALVAVVLLFATPAHAQFTRERSWLRMPDGVHLAVTYWRPIQASEKLPVLLEYLPYRKDDSFYQRDDLDLPSRAPDTSRRREFAVPDGLAHAVSHDDLGQGIRPGHGTRIARDRSGLRLAGPAIHFAGSGRHGARCANVTRDRLSHGGCHARYRGEDYGR
jgi:hypothetical protein